MQREDWLLCLCGWRNTTGENFRPLSVVTEGEKGAHWALPSGCDIDEQMNGALRRLTRQESASKNDGLRGKEIILWKGVK